ncbi:DMT family transporter [Alloyangia pacifica]|uniref:DMT family transporter n=1 Tax=Alloyangia pacifica TaxID=311180 RepID=UPI001CD65086|nr:DMT family transporter [Alloyangia pacifica]MCA0998167.1 DMT family transporter [Alloyangia pacifica]
MTTMTDARITFFASAIVLATGAFWGFYWLPVRALSEMGLPGAWGTAAITLAAVIVLLPLAVARRGALRRAGPVALASVALGGAAFALYSVAFVYGRVAIIILLYFLTPVWSTLIGRYVMGWHTPRMRIVAILVGLAGLTVMLSADGTAPMPRSIGEWMALLAGLLWSIATTGIRSKSDLAPGESAFVFAAGAMICAFVLAPVLEPLPAAEGLSLAPLLGVAAASGAIWWALSVAALMWATVRLEPARVGILLMSEVLVGAVSAAALAGEHLAALELLGGGLVLVAGVLEVWPVRQRRASHSV